MSTSFTSLMPPMPPEIVLDEGTPEFPKHEYRVNGIVTPSVTQVLNATGLADFSHVPEYLKDFVLARGKAAHMAIHFFLEGDLDESSLSDDTKGCVESLRKFLFASDFRPYAGMIERILHSQLYAFCGKLDVIGELPQYGPAIGDWKRGMMEGVEYQTAAYLLCVNSGERSMPCASPVFQRFGLKLDPTGKCAKVKMFPVRNLKDDQDTFLAALRVFKKQGARR